MSTHRFDRERGFTLLELLVAAAILALIAVFSWRGLDALLRERETIASSQDLIDTNSRVFARIERDALLARDAELSDDGELRLVANPAAPTATAAVAYRLSNGELVRTVNDGSPPIVLMDKVTAGTFDLYVSGRGPGSGWVQKRAGAQDPGPAAARAGTAGVANPNTQNGANTVGTQLPVANPNNANAAANAPGTDNTRGQAPQGAQQNAVATGLRLVLARADGTSLVRIFMIGGGG